MSMRMITAAIACILALTLSLPSRAEGGVVYTYTASGDYTTLGNNKKSQCYDVAICVADPSLKGKRVVGLEVPVVASANVTGYSAWLSKELKLINNSEGRKAAAPDICAKEGEPSGGVLRVTFDQPYEIDGDFYAGYSFSVGEIDDVSGYPVVVAPEENPDGLWFHASRSVLSWQMKSDEYHCVTPLKVLLEGEFGENAAAVVAAPGGKVMAGQASAYTFKMANHGLSEIADIDYTLEYGGEKTDGHIAFDETLKCIYNLPREVTVGLPPVSALGTTDLKLTITRVNGQANADGQSGLTAVINVCDVLPVHRALLEEFTGLWCGFCVRGYAAIEYMWGEHSDKCVPVVYHNGDPMAITFPVSVESFPWAMVDRTTDVNPAHGPGCTDMYRTVEKRAAEPCDVAIGVSDFVVESDGAVSFTADITWAAQPESGRDYSVQWVLMSDNLTNPSWGQKNYLVGDTTYAAFPGMEQFINGSSVVYGLTFNNVAIMNNGPVGQSGLLDDVKAGETKRLQFTCNYNDAVSTYSSANKKCLVQDPKDLKVAIIIFDKDSYGKTYAVNANVSARPSLTGIGDIASDTSVESVSYYSADGRSLRIPAGVVIKLTRYKDGTQKAEKAFVR